MADFGVVETLYEALHKSAEAADVAKHNTLQAREPLPNTVYILRPALRTVL